MGGTGSELRPQPGSVKLDQYRTQLDEFCRRVVEQFAPDCIILHGSFARDRAGPWSDVDVVVVGDRLPAKWDDRWRALRQLAPDDLPLQAAGYHAHEWEQMLEDGELLALEALEFGIALHGTDYLERLRARLELMKQHGLRREEICWYVPQSARDAARRDRENASPPEGSL
jgi:predicted nucleotidyltransferase